MFCPQCNAKIEKIEWGKPHKHLPASSEIKCRKCKTMLCIEDRSPEEQEGYIEIIFH
jgi:hypothetical protein